VDWYQLPKIALNDEMAPDHIHTSSCFYPFDSTIMMATSMPTPI
jgi:hypothetical protein